MKPKKGDKIVYTCPGCKHTWTRTMKYDAYFEFTTVRLCTGCDASRAARVHEAAARRLFLKARDIFNRRAARRSGKEVDPT